MSRPRRPARRHAALAAAAALAVAAFASCGDPAPDPFDDAKCRGLLADPESADAIAWLQAPTRHRKAPGGMDPDAALALAYRFQQFGARRIVAVGNTPPDAVSRDRPRLESFGLVLELPDDPAARRAVFQLYAPQARNYGYAPRADTGQKYLFVPWTRADPA